MSRFWLGANVRHATDPHGRSHGTVLQSADQHGLVRVRWFGAHEPDDWTELVIEDELRFWEPKKRKESK